jgi:HNH endonuclease
MPRVIYNQHNLPPIEERMRNYVETPGPLETPCWIWQGAPDTSDGYGHIRWNGTDYLAHRASWIFHVAPISDDLHVLHHCDTPLCVNPDHLWRGTDADNVDDMWAKGRENPAKRTGNAVLNEVGVALIRYFIECGWSPTELARRYQIGRRTIRNIRSWETWKHVPAFAPKPGEPLPVPPGPKAKRPLSPELEELRLDYGIECWLEQHLTNGDSNGSKTHRQIARTAHQ